MDVEHTLEVEAGRAQPSTIGLSPGEPVGPLSIGRMGGWRVAANGVAAEHGYLYFDGRDLWLQSLDPGAPMYADGIELPLAWTAVRAPCEIALGAARIRFAETEVEVERTADRFPAPTTPGVAAPPQPPSQPAPPPSQRLRPANPFARGELARPPEEADSTRMGPLDVAAARARSAALSSVRPSVPRAHLDSEIEHPTTVARGSHRPAGPSGPPPGRAPSSVPPSSRAPEEQLAAGPSRPSPPLPPEAPAPRDLEERDPLDEKPTQLREIHAPRGLMAAWNAASFPQKVTLFLLPLALGSVYVIFTDAPSSPEAEEPAAAVTASATPSARSSVAPSSAVPPTPAPPSSIIDAAPPSAHATRPTAPSQATDPAPSSQAIEASPVPAPTTPGRKGSAQRTLERRAADSVAAGDWEGAAELYDQLAKEHPETKAFAEAARILRARH